MTVVKRWCIDCKWRWLNDTDRCVECWNDPERPGWEAEDIDYA